MLVTGLTEENSHAHTAAGTQTTIQALKTCTRYTTATGWDATKRLTNATAAVQAVHILYAGGCSIQVYVHLGATQSHRS